MLTLITHHMPHSDSICSRLLQVGCSHESAAYFYQGSGRGGLSGLASPQEGEPQVPGEQVEEILVRPEEELPVLVQRQDGESKKKLMTSFLIRTHRGQTQRLDVFSFL